MVYYTPVAAPWSISGMEDLPPLIFLHNFGGGPLQSEVYPACHQLPRVSPGLNRVSLLTQSGITKFDYLTTLAELSNKLVALSGGGGVSLTAAGIRLAIQQRFISSTV